MIKRLLLLVLALLTISLVVNSQISSQPGASEADRLAIRKEIEIITQAFIDQDIEKIHDTHSEDWRGFLGPTQVPIKGIDEYMKANGIPYPPPAGYTKPGPNPHPNLHFEIHNFDVNLVTPDVGVASFSLDFPRGDGKDFNRLRILDVFAKRNGKWIQVASDTIPDPTWQAEQAAAPVNLSPDAKNWILEQREAVWRAWFANDREKLEKMIPDEAIAIDGTAVWENRTSILDSSKRFADGGAKLTRLEFPRTEIQMYGNTVILYTSYSFDIEQNGQKQTSTGNGIETFIRKGSQLLNTGWILATK